MTSTAADVIAADVIAFRARMAAQVRTALADEFREIHCNASDADIERAARHFRASPVPELTAEDITITVDNMGREVIVIPDAVAAELGHEVRRGWREFRGEANGESRRFAPGTWAYRTTDLIMTVFAESTVSETLTMWPEKPRHGDEIFPKPTRARMAEIVRERTAGPNGYLAGGAFIIGRSGWDFAARWWAFDVRSLAHKALSPKGYPARVTRPADGHFVHFTG
jgi:hypothetical protein